MPCQQNTSLVLLFLHFSPHLSWMMRVARQIINHWTSLQSQCLASSIFSILHMSPHLYHAHSVITEVSYFYVSFSLFQESGHTSPVPVCWSLCLVPRSLVASAFHCLDNSTLMFFGSFYCFICVWPKGTCCRLYGLGFSYSLCFPFCNYPDEFSVEDKVEKRL